MSWPKVRLGDVLRHRKNFITIDDLKIYKRVRVQVHAQGIVVRDVVPGAMIKTKRQQACRAGEFLVAEIDAKVGGFGIVPESLEDGIVSSHYFLYEIDESKLDRGFLDFFIRTHTFRDQVEAQGSTNYAAIRPADVLGYQIPLPSVAEQKRVVARIEELSRYVDEARLLQKQGGAELEALSHSIIESKYRRLCTRYGLLQLSDVCESITDGDHNTPTFTDIGIKFIFVGNISTGRLHFDNCKRVSEDYFREIKPQRIPKRGDILYSAVGATLGVPIVVDSDEQFCFQRHIAILKTDLSRVDSRFVCHMLNSRTVFEKAWGSTTGSAQPTIPLRAIRELSIPIPSLHEQQRIVAELEAVLAHVITMNRMQSETTKEVDALLLAILDQAFNGNL